MKRHTLDEAIAILEATSARDLAEPSHWQDDPDDNTNTPERYCPLLSIGRAMEPDKTLVECDPHGGGGMIEYYEYEPTLSFWALMASMGLNRNLVNLLTNAYDSASTRSEGKRKVLKALRAVRRSLRASTA